MHRPERLALELARHGIRAIGVRVDDSQEPYGLSLQLKFFIDAGVIASKDAYTDDGDGNRIVRSQKTFSMASCRKEIVNGNGGEAAKE